jgi:hypothetical protein
MAGTFMGTVLTAGLTLTSFFLLIKKSWSRDGAGFRCKARQLRPCLRTDTQATYRSFNACQRSLQFSACAMTDTRRCLSSAVTACAPAGSCSTRCLCCLWAWC